MSYNHDGGGEGVMSRRMRIDCGLGRQWLKSEAGDCMFSQEKTTEPLEDAGREFLRDHLILSPTVCSQFSRYGRVGQ